MIDHIQFRHSILVPSLKAINLWSQEAEELLILTMAQESLGGTYFEQIKGPALGIFQMEPKTHDDIWTRFLPAHPNYARDMLTYLQYSRKPTAEILVHNLSYACMMTRLHYVRVEEPLPSTDVEKMASYWNRYYNCNPDKGTDIEAISNYLKFVNKEPSYGKNDSRVKGTREKRNENSK